MDSFKTDKGIESSTGMEIKVFKPRSLQGDVVHSYEETKQKYGELLSPMSINNAEVKAAGNIKAGDARFNLDPAAKRSLGIEKEEGRFLEEKIASEVAKRMEEAAKKAYEDGFARGKVDGEVLAKNEFQTQAKPVFDQFTALVTEFENAKQEIYKANEQFLIQLIFQISKHVLLKELKTDPEYLKRLSMQLIEKIGAKDHIKIKISTADQSQIETMREYLKQQMSELKNIQIEASEEVLIGGCKVETDLARIDASVDTQLKMMNDALGGV